MIMYDYEINDAFPTRLSNALLCDYAAAWLDEA